MTNSHTLGPPASRWHRGHPFTVCKFNLTSWKRGIPRNECAAMTMRWTLSPHTDWRVLIPFIWNACPAFAKRFLLPGADDAGPFQLLFGTWYAIASSLPNAAPKRS